MHIWPLLLLLAAAPAATGPAVAAAAGAGEPTLVHLSETAERAVANDLYVALLDARAEAATAADAQAELNRVMAQALQMGEAVAGMAVTTRGYHVRADRSDDAPERWIATQGLRLETTTRDDLLALVGRLQALDLSLRSLGGELSRDGRLAVRNALIREAIAALDARAAVVAAALGLNRAGWQQLTVDGAGPEPRPMMMAEARTADAAPPSLRDATTTVRVGVSGTARLVP